MASEAAEEEAVAMRLGAVTKAVAEMDLAGLGQLATQEAVDSYIASAGEALETRANQVLQAYGWLGDVLPGEKLKAMVTWPLEKAEETQGLVLKKWESIWGNLPPTAQQHLDAASFKKAFLLDEGFSLAKKHLQQEKAAEGSPAKRPRQDLLPSVPAGLAGQTIEEILQNGRSANRLKCWVLAATGSPQARKTGRGKPSNIVSILVSDGKMDAVITCWGECAKTLHDGASGRQGQHIALAPLGAGTRNPRMGLPELLGGRGLTIEVVADGEEEGVPPPSFLPLQQLAEVGDWASVNIQGRVLEIMPGGDFKVVDDCGVAVRVHAELARLPQLQEGQKVDLLLATKSSRFANVSISSFTAIRPGAAAGSRSCGPAFSGHLRLVSGRCSPMAATWGVRFGMCQGGKISCGCLQPLKAPAAARLRESLCRRCMQNSRTDGRRVPFGASLPCEYSPTAATWGVRFGMCQGGKSHWFPTFFGSGKSGAGLLPPLKAPAAAEAGPYLLWHVEFNYG